jgi:hypothetical protein
MVSICFSSKINKTFGQVYDEEHSSKMIKNFYASKILTQRKNRRDIINA